MKNLKTFGVILSIITLGSLLWGLYSDEFLIGAYSSMRSHLVETGYNQPLSEGLHSAGFNATRAIAVYYPDLSKVGALANILNADSLDLMLEDQIFSSTTPGQKYGYAALSAGIYQKFEAEYSSEASLNAGDENSDKYFYKSVDRVGAASYDSYFSNGYAWQVPSGSRGYAYKDLLYRWPYRPTNHTYRIGPGFRFLRTRACSGNQTPVEDDSLYVKFVFEVMDLESYASTDTLAIFNFSYYSPSDAIADNNPIEPNFRYVYHSSDNLNYHSVYFFYEDNPTPLLNKIITKADYEALPSANNPQRQTLKSIEFHFPLELAGDNSRYSLLGQEVIEEAGWYYRLKNLNPNMFWCGKGELHLDYIEYTDKMFKNFIHNAYQFI